MADRNTTIRASQLRNFTVSAEDIKVNSITGDKFVDVTISGGKIADEAISESKLDIFNSPVDGDYLKYTTTSGMGWTTLIDTFLGLTDTPSAYSGGKYLVSTSSGTIWSSAMSNYSVSFTNDTGVDLVVGDLISGYDDGGYILSESLANGDPNSGWPTNGNICLAKFVVTTDTSNGNNGYCTDFSYITVSGHGYSLGPLYLGANAKLTQNPSEDFLSQLVGFVDTADTFQIRLDNSRALEPVGGGTVIVGEYGADNASPVKLPYTKSGRVLTSYNYSSGGTQRGAKWEDPQAILVTVTGTGALASGIVYGDLVYREATISLQDNMETPGNWVPSNGTVALNSTTYIEGSGSLELNKTSTGGNYVLANKTGLTENLTNKVIYIYAYVKDQTTLNKIQGIQFYAGTGSPGSNAWWWAKHSLDNELGVGWNTIGPLDPTNSGNRELDPWMLNRVGTPVLTNVNYYTIRFYTSNNSDITSSGDVLWDYLHFKTTNIWKKCDSNHNRPEGVYNNLSPDGAGVVFLAGRIPHYYGLLPNTTYYVDENGQKTTDVTSIRLGKSDKSESFYLGIDGDTTSSGITNHGELFGLSDDDHTQYLLASGTRNIAGNITQDDGYYIATDEIRARDSGGLYLRDDSGTLGIHIKDGGQIGLSTGADINEFSTDTTLAGNSDDAVPTEKAVKAYVDANTTGSGYWDRTGTVISPLTDGDTLEIPDLITAGIEWTTRSGAADNNWTSVAYGNGTFAAVAYSGNDDRAMTSPDGVHWTTRSGTGNNNWFSITYGNGVFVALAITGNNDRVMTSPDGITWTSRTGAADVSWRSVAYGDGIFVAVSSAGTVMTSPDGITWTPRTAAAANCWMAVTYGNGLFVAVAYSGVANRVMTSPDGINWTIRTSASDVSWIGVTYGHGLFVAVAYAGTGNRVMTSPDGITWTLRASADDNNDWRSVVYGNGIFAAVGRVGDDRVMTSPDGITWTSRTHAATNDWNGITYGNGIFVAVSYTGTNNRIMTSGKTEIAKVQETGNAFKIKGRNVSETDVPTDGQVITWNASNSEWEYTTTSGGGSSDHGLLTGLFDDDHTQYLLASGTRSLTGDWNIGNFKLGINRANPSWPLHIVYPVGDENATGIHLNIAPTGTATAGRQHTGIDLIVNSTHDQSAYYSILKTFKLAANIDVGGHYNSAYAIESYLNNKSSSNMASMNGIFSAIYNESTATIFSVYAAQTLALQNGAGQMTLAYGHYSTVRVSNASGTILSGYGYYAYLDHQNGTANTGYLFRGDYSGTWGAKWGIYLTNETKSYFSGQVGIKEMSPAADLDVDGTLILQNGTSINEFSTDTTLSGNSDDAVPTEKAVKTYVDDIHVIPSLYIKVSDTKANNTDAGTFTQGAWQTRVLNTEDNDIGNHCSISSNQITLDAGTYECRISAPAYDVQRHQIRLRNTTAGTTILIGTSEIAAQGGDVSNRSFIRGRFTITASQALEVQHRCQYTVAAAGFGSAVNFGSSEIYTVAEFWKVNAVTGATSEADATIGIVETGSYTGDGSTSHVINFQDSSIIPKMIWVHGDWDADINNTARTVLHWDAEMAPDRSFGHTATAGHLIYTNRIIAATTGSFTVDDAGADNFPNSNGIKYDYTVIGTKTITAVATAYEGYQSRVSVYRSTVQSLGAGVWTKIQLNIEDFDGLNEFDNSSTYRFTPTANGYYQVCISMGIQSLAANKRIGIAIRKNGSGVANSQIICGAGANRISTSKLIYLTTSDYIEHWGQHTDTVARNVEPGTGYTYMTVHRLS